MTKMSSGRKAAKGISAPQMMTVDPTVDGEPVEVDTLSERWTECKLTDGTVIKVKPVIIEVRKTKTIRNPVNGEPIYFVKSQMITDTQVNPALRKK